MTLPEIRYHDFVCPQCGSKEWGTENLTGPWEEWVGQCAGCSFRWSRSDDAQYWQPVNDVEWDEVEEEDDPC